ncbi:MAG: EAL domain-containing protein [Sulfurimonas sp.]
MSVKLFNNRILYIIPIVFIIVILLKVVYAYNDTKERRYEFAKKEAEVLNSYAMTHREYYQNFFINKIIPLNKETLSALPAFSSSIISETFSQQNPLNITIKTVSDRARNIKNSADSDELKAIEYLRQNSDKENYFSESNSGFFQFAHALKIEQKCLLCHGAKQDAPKLIRDSYENAYDYKLGEIRGIISIKIPVKALNDYFYRNFIHSILYDSVLFLFLFFTIFYIIKKVKNINNFLETTIEEKTAELKNSFIYDSLTHLPNRIKLIEDIQRYKNSKFLHLALFNIDSFKELNDFYGYEIGDKILKEIAQTIEETCQSNENIFYKLPSDEYALLSTKNVSKGIFLSNIKEMLKRVNKKEIEIDGNQIFITMSCGLASSEQALMSKANMALQNAKNTKKDIVIYDGSLDMTSKIVQNIEGASFLKDTINKNLITPYYQPIYNVQTKKIEKYECLARIIKEDGEVIPPLNFLDIAIKSKQYPNITKAMITKSFNYFQDKDYEFSINLSINDVLNKKTFAFIMKKLSSFNAAHRVVFEILESDKIENYEEIKEFIESVKKFGCKIAIDDFGSGYSNFAHILELNIDYLKIDSSLVKNVTSDENSRKITQTIINFALNLGLETIAEFVEDKDSLEMLKKMGVNYAQGYYIGKPQREIL